MSSSNRDETAAERRERLAERYAAYKAARLERPPQWLDPAPARGEDTVWRGLTRRGEARVLFVRLTALLQHIQRVQQLSPAATRLMGEALVAARLVRSTVNPEAQLQWVLKTDGAAGQVVVDVWAEGGMRGLVAERSLPSAVADRAIGAGLLLVARRNQRGRFYQSQLAVHGGTVETIAMRYLLESEQLLTFLRLAVDVDEHGVIRSACGALLQMMPEAEKGDLEDVLANVEAAGPLRAAVTEDDPDARGWFDAVLDGFRWDQSAREDVSFDGRSSRARVMQMLATLSRAELTELVDAGEALEVVDEFTRETYRVGVDELQALVGPSN